MVISLAERLLAEPEPEHALKACRSELASAGFDVEIDEEQTALVAHRDQGGVAFSGHVDVVPVGEEWTVDAFGNALEDGRLYGRGAVDMRGPVACMVAALERTQAPASIVLTSDEETTMDTVRSFVDEDVLDDSAAIVVGEPTGLDVACASKGLVWARLTARGERGHASTPRSKRGGSAAERLVDAVSGLPASPLRVSHPRVGESTLAVSGLGGEQTPFNVLAGRTEARVDVRFPPPKMPDDVRRALASHLGGPPEGVELELEKREPPFLGDEDVADRAASALRAAGMESGLVGVDYVSEAGHWQRVSPTVICGPGSIDRAHKPDEYVERDELENGVRAYEALVEAYAPT